MNKLKKASGKLVGSTTKTTKKVVAAPTVLIGDEVANFSESISSKGSRVRYPPETQKLYSDKIIKVFDLPKNTPMKLRLIAPCQAYSEKTKQFETGELVITRKSIAFIGDNEENSRALKRNEIKSCKEGKKESEPQLKVNFKGKQKPFKMQGMTPTNAKRARKLIGHLVKEKDSKKGSTLLSLSGPLGFGKKKKKHEESKSEKPDDDDSDSSSLSELSDVSFDEPSMFEETSDESEEKKDVFTETSEDDLSKELKDAEAAALLAAEKEREEEEERKRKEEEERLAREAEEKRLEEERLAREAEEKRLEEERKRKEEEERLAKEEEERKRKEEEERLAREAEERRLEEERLAREEEERRKREEEEQQRALEAAALLAAEKEREEEERKRKEEEERLAREAEEKRLEEERLAKEAEKKRLEEERLAKEEEERKRKEEEERLAKEAEEKRLEKERLAKEEEERKQKEEKERLAKEAEQKRVEEERLAKLEVERLAKEAEKKRLEEERLAKEAEKKRLEEERLAKEAEKKRLKEESLAEEAEEKRLKEEHLAEEAEKKRLKEESLAEEAEKKRITEENLAEEVRSKRLKEEQRLKKIIFALVPIILVIVACIVYPTFITNSIEHVTSIENLNIFRPSNISPKFTIFLFNSQKTPMKEGILRNYFIENLKEFENTVDFIMLYYDNSEHQFFSSEGFVSKDKLKESLNLFIFHETGHKIEGQWSKEMYDKLLTDSHGNCVWTYTKEERLLNEAYAPTTPSGVISGINLYSNNPVTKILQYHFQGNTINVDEFNGVNLNKLKKLISEKFQLHEL